MKPFREMTYAELRSAFRARCIGWLAAHDDDNDMAMFCHASVMGLILEEWDKRLRGQATREPPMLHVVPKDTAMVINFEDARQ